jgi:hypothetical protein
MSFDFNRITPGEFVHFMNDPNSESTAPMQVLVVGEASVEGLVWNASKNLGSLRIMTAYHATDKRLLDPNFVHIMGEDDAGIFVESPQKIAQERVNAELLERIEALEAKTKGRGPAKKKDEPTQEPTARAAAEGKKKDDDEDEDSEESKAETETVRLRDILGPQPGIQDPSEKARILASAK